MRKCLIALVAIFAMLACVAGCAPSQPSGSAGDVQASTSAEGSESSGASSETSESANASDGADASEGAEASNGSEADGNPSASAKASSAAADASVAFSSWNSDAGSLAALIDYVEAATEEGGKGYVPPEDRVAVFDMDGTFLCEKAPVYADYMLLLHRVLDDPDFTPTDEMRELCNEIRASADQGLPFNDADRAYKKNDALAQSFAGMTFDEFHGYVADFMATKAVEGFSGMTYGESFYKPMLEVIDYLQANDFEVYVVTASEREVARVIVEPLGIDASHVIGSDWAYTATNQGGEEGGDYTYAKDDELLIAGYYLGETGKTNKVIAIQREIGKHPVLAFGNSTYDFAMLNYALDNEEYPSAAYLVIADDTEREYGDAEKAAEMLASAQDAGFTGISMRDDWSTIYGDGVEKTQLRANETEATAEAA